MDAVEDPGDAVVSPDEPELVEEVVPVVDELASPGVVDPDGVVDPSGPVTPRAGVVAFAAPPAPGTAPVAFATGTPAIFALVTPPTRPDFGANVCNPPLALSSSFDQPLHPLPFCDLTKPPGDSSTGEGAITSRESLGTALAPGGAQSGLIFISQPVAFSTEKSE